VKHYLWTSNMATFYVDWAMRSDFCPVAVPIRQNYLAPRRFRGVPFQAPRPKLGTDPAPRLLR
jgi:hypothetical protein